MGRFGGTAGRNDTTNTQCPVLELSDELLSGEMRLTVRSESEKSGAACAGRCLWEGAGLHRPR
eukprot:10975382-Alexandrium_andersonii.AAC.1